MQTLPLIQRQLTTRASRSFDLRKIRLCLLDGEGCESGFTGMAAPVAPKFDTRMIVLRKPGELLVCALLCSMRKCLRESSTHYKGSIEVLFDRRNDMLGFTQLVFKEGEAPVVNDFSPYPEAKSTRSLPLKIKRWGFNHQSEANSSMFGLAHPLFFAVFDEHEIFQHSPTVGFNLCRQDDNSGDFSSWNFMAGNGSPDACSLGKLHRESRAAKSGRTPPAVPPAGTFRVAITNDSPMVVVNRHYTPASLDAEMRGIKRWGVNRLHWIDYSNYRSFWTMPLWKKQYARTVKECGEDLLAAACKAARKHNIEVVPNFKIFDLSFRAQGGTPKHADSLPGPDGPDILCIPEMTKNEDAFMQSNPAWRRTASYPIHTIRLYSTGSLPPVNPSDLRISQSADNMTYRKVRVNPALVTVKKTSRPNRRWTPAGIQTEHGSQPSWMIEVRGISITQPFASVEIPAADGFLLNRHFAMVEAIGKDGTEAPFICSDTRNTVRGGPKYNFTGVWPGWNNYNDHSFALTRLNLKSFGIAMIEPPALTGMLEPAHPISQKIWLDRVDYYLEHDIAGLEIRTLCHHRRCQSWLQYAFAPSVLDAFKNCHGRMPEPREEDYAEIRRLRGGALGDFLAAASAKVRAKKKKFIFQVETGSELPPERDSRMAMYYDYEKWISSGLFDELQVRSISAHSPWLRQTILPLARKHGVQVHLLTRNLATGFGAREFLDIRRIASDAKDLGYDGINFYEAANLYELTDADTFLPRAMAELSVREAVRRTSAV